MPRRDGALDPGRARPTVNARFKDLCIDAVDPGRLGPFWAAALGLTWHTQAGGDGWLAGPTPQHTIWVNAVPEPRLVKARVHLDIYTAIRLQALRQLRARWKHRAPAHEEQKECTT